MIQTLFTTLNGHFLDLQKIIQEKVNAKHMKTILWFSIKTFSTTLNECFLELYNLTQEKLKF